MTAFTFGKSAFGVDAFGVTPYPSTATVVPPTPLVSQTINAYAYQQYADDDDIQAFFTAYNGMTQAYVTWFASIGLPIYTGLTGSLLDWVAQGLYGLQRTSLTSPGTSAAGMPNTFQPNTTQPNTFSPATTIFYNVSDDFFQRILTWDFYKGDGKRFCPLWLKRRIMRFLVGTNGIDPQPSNAGFVVGAETTSAIGVAINTSTNTLTVTINQTLLGQQANLAPGILQVFSAAFESQSLDLPIQYTYVCNIVSAVVAFASPTSVTSSSPNSTQTTGAVVVTAYSGSGTYTYTWIFISGGSGISINSPFSATTTFTASTLVAGQNVMGIAQCTVLDTVTLASTTVTVLVSITNGSLGLLQNNGAPILAKNGNPLLLG